ncbi:porphobilinogen deaminase [Enterococcus haemoperoxidus ATCC BAA-382]|uniref:Porphobilinogen deaminase n=1 Tax=Enterococcus haemoperoxidus ATCC BAA-382 TaxID=1158608 RepID=R2QDT9_9ENTE|nr:hydroxymethylbilane synthase [Enterococcus haemoperoxidus]EOH93368.1 porphobilinogen deaminase [Enterococcus haemoperoxidus ATCC BAA-382]EOT61322.1 porphobilinogen deaminase [Enterococcus haemoperoxidus ATCC BAA-382]OJG54504.1 porphobilinogen deaminase [Enterococcus haemoperoxidus]
MKTVRVGTRNSPLAMKQTKIVLDLLKEVQGEFPVEIIPMTTKGDQMLSVSLSKIGGKGLFINEVEQALLKGTIDFAVHSLKDMPAKVADGLTLAAIPERTDPADCLIFREVSSLDALPIGARIGTSSLRREFHMKNLRADLQVESIRGNVGTRLKRMEEQGLDGIVLAVAGLKRLNWFDVPTHPYVVLTSEQCIPAVGQGALAVECRSQDQEMNDFLSPIDDLLTRKLVMEERAFLAMLNGNCDIPIGAYAVQEQNGYRFSGFLGDKKLQQSFTKTIVVQELSGVGAQIAAELLDEMNQGSL